MALIFIFGLLLWGWIELSVFIFVSNEVSSLATLLGVFLTAIVGIALLKKQGPSLLNRVRSDLANGHPPVVSIADSISLVVGGGLMLIPGYVTDGVGLLLFVPGFRTIVGMYLLKWVARKPIFTGYVNFNGNTFTRGNGNQDPFGFSERSQQQNEFDDAIEGEFEERPDEKIYVDQKKRDHHDDG